MPPHICHVFIDGGYLRVEAAKRWNTPDVNPLNLAMGLVDSPMIQTWASASLRHNALLGRVTYYDGLPDDNEETDSKTDLENDAKKARDKYWRAIELLPDVHLGFGGLTGLKRKPRKQKGVDTLIAVDMLVGAFSELFDIAVLVAGDGDFTPVVEEVRRRGVMVAVVAVSESLSDDLLRVADRFVEINSAWVTPMKVE